MGPGIPPACSMRTAASLIGKGNAVQQLLKPPPLRQLAHYVVKRPLTIEHDIAGRQRRTPIWQAIRNRLQQKIKAMRLLTTRRSQVQVLSPQPEKAPQSNGLRCFFCTFPEKTPGTPWVVSHVWHTFGTQNNQEPSSFFLFSSACAMHSEKRASACCRTCP